MRGSQVVEIREDIRWQPAWDQVVEIREGIRGKPARNQVVQISERIRREARGAIVGGHAAASVAAWPERQA